MRSTATTDTSPAAADAVTSIELPLHLAPACVESVSSDLIDAASASPHSGELSRGYAASVARTC